MGGVKGKSTLVDRVCKQCGITFLGGPRAWYCPGCRLERRRKRDVIRYHSGPVRHLGDTDKCVVCGADYIVTGGNQKYCPDCAQTAVAEKDRQKALEWYNENKAEYNPARNEKRRVKQATCIVCGKLFDRNGKPTKLCSPECREIRKKQWTQNAYAKSREKIKLERALQEVPEAKAKKWILKSPDGQIYECDNLAKFFREHQHLINGTPQQARAAISNIKQKMLGHVESKCIPLWHGWDLIGFDGHIYQSETKKFDTAGYITGPEFCKLKNIGTAYFSKLCIDGRIPGATKIQGRWYVPKDASWPPCRDSGDGPDGYIPYGVYAKKHHVSKMTVWILCKYGVLHTAIKIHDTWFIDSCEPMPEEVDAEKREKPDEE